MLCSCCLKARFLPVLVENVLNSIKSTFEPDRRYVHELSRINHFDLDFYVDINSIWNIKEEIVHIHKRFHDDRYVKMAERSAINHGRTNRSRTLKRSNRSFHFPISGLRIELNVRWWTFNKTRRLLHMPKRSVSCLIPKNYQIFNYRLWCCCALQLGGISSTRVL